VLKIPNCLGKNFRKP